MLVMERTLSAAQLFILGLLLNGASVCADSSECVDSCDANAVCVQGTNGLYACECSPGFNGNGSHCVASASTDTDGGGEQSAFVWIGVGVGVLVLVALITTLAIISACLCSRRMKAGRRGFYDTYEDIVSKSTMVHYTASLRSISSQHVGAANERVVDRENEFYV